MAWRRATSVANDDVPSGHFLEDQRANSASHYTVNIKNFNCLLRNIAVKRQRYLPRNDLFMPIYDNIPDEPVQTLGLLLIEGFALMSYASIVEPFRAANVLAGRTLYRWQHISVDGRPVRASNGATILADGSVGQPLACDTLFIFAAGESEAFSDDATFAWLRSLARRQVRLAGISGGPLLLAKAGLLDGYSLTLHWDHQPAYMQAFPTHVVAAGLYVIDRRRMTCAGGTAGLDLAIELIEREQGHSLATQVSEWFIHTESRTADRPQRLSLRERYAISNDAVLKALSHMEANIERPVPRTTLSAVVGVSVRQLERLFMRHLNETLASSYLRLRLAQAEIMLRKTSQSVTEITLACGFQSSSHFSRAFKQRYGRAPGQARR